MRVLFNTYPVAFECPGGGEIQLVNSKDALENAGVEVLLHDPWHAQIETVDVVHYFSVQGGSMNFCGYVKNAGKPLVISPILWLGRETETYPLDEIKQLLTISDMVFPNSFAEAKKLSRFFNIDLNKFHVTYNAVENCFTETPPNNDFRKHFDINGPFILNVANIEPRKNQLRLIEAIKELDLRLVMIGHVRDKQYFNRCMEAGEGHVRYIGYIEHHDPILVSAYRQCALFVLPSLLETPGLSALEAAVCDAKIVVTGIGSTREYFEDFVTYVDPYDTSNISNGIKNSLNNRKDDRLKRNIMSKFRWEHTALQLMEGYRLAIKANNAKQH